MDKDVAFFRYADDFIVIAPSREVITRYIIPKVKSFLLEIGLNLNEAKTRIVNISEGFRFLGFEFRRFYRRDGSIKEFSHFPSRERLDRFLANLKLYIRSNWNVDVKDLIRGLNRRIRGFCNYYKWSKAYKAFSYLSHRIWEILWQWAKRRHRRKRGRKWIRDRYWKSIGNSKWIFSFEGVHMIEPYSLTAQWWKYPKVRIHTSPYDYNALAYWEKRRNRYKGSKMISWISKRLSTPIGSGLVTWNFWGEIWEDSLKETWWHNTEYLGLKPRAVKVARGVLMSRGRLTPSDSCRHLNF